MHNKRLVAYLFDLILITVITSIVFIFIPVKKTNKIEANMDTLVEQYANKKISGVSYFMQMSMLEKEKSEGEIVKISVNVVLLILYYIVVPFFNQASTFGMQILHLKIEGKDKKISLLSLFIRALLMDGLLSTLLLFFGIYVVNSKFYLSYVSILILLQLLALIVNYFMIKYRKDALGLSDILSRSTIIQMS